jgi:transcriptional regulator with XRE-family HTH domain
MEKELEELKKLHQFYLYYDYKTIDIARKLNVSKKTVQRWLSGKTKPTEEKLKEIRKLLIQISNYKDEKGGR